MRIGFAGTVSVGKTTLVKALQELPEFKDYNFRTERSKYLMGLGIPLNTDSTVKGQTVFLAERASELIEEKIITDRTIIDVMAFTKSAKSISLIEGDKFCDFASSMLKDYDYIFYVSPEGVEIEDNGVREINSGYRDYIDHTITNLLIEHRKNIRNLVHIKGSTDERIETVRQAIFS
jgi:nicotinamide riboside kinase